MCGEILPLMHCRIRDRSLKSQYRRKSTQEEQSKVKDDRGLPAGHWRLLRQLSVGRNGLEHVATVVGSHIQVEPLR